MPRESRKTHKRPIERYEHKGKKRVNNPPVGLVTPETDPPALTRRTYEFDPHLDPQLAWAGKKEQIAIEAFLLSRRVANCSGRTLEAYAANLARFQRNVAINIVSVSAG